MSTKPTGTSPPSRWVSFALDFAPLLLFFLAYKAAGIFVGTAIFMMAITVAVICGLVLFRRVSPMTWLSAVLVIGFGGLTIYLHDPTFIQVKPTIIYTALALILFGGLAVGRPLLEPLLGYAFPNLEQRGWMLLSRNWALFFVFLAIANEVLRTTLSFDAWLTVKVWGVTVLSFLFSAANVPMLLRHGLDSDVAKDVAPPPVE